MDFNSDFKYDLKVGQVAEKKLADIFTAETIEVKFDLQSWKTGNTFVEYESRGKPSGISTSEATFYAFVFEHGSTVIIDTADLKNIIRPYLGSSRDIKGGDSNTSKGILLPICKLLINDRTSG